MPGSPEMILHSPIIAKPGQGDRTVFDVGLRCLCFVPARALRQPLQQEELYHVLLEH